MKSDASVRCVLEEMTRHQIASMCFDLTLVEVADKRNRIKQGTASLLAVV